MTRVNNFVENGGRLCRTLARSVSVDVDPNAQKKNFTKCSVFFREVTPDSPSPRKPHINTGSRSNTAPLGQMPVWGVFGVRVARVPLGTARPTPLPTPVKFTKRLVNAWIYPALWGVD